MPTYGYTCPACRHQFDKMQKMSDSTPADCPKCDTPSVRQISGGAGIVFKGSGFYETDYKRAGEPSSKKDDSPKPDKTEPGEKKPEKKESKPSSAPDSKPKGSDS